MLYHFVCLDFNCSEYIKVSTTWFSFLQRKENSLPSIFDNFISNILQNVTNRRNHVRQPNYARLQYNFSSVVESIHFKIDLEPILSFTSEINPRFF